MGEEKTDGPSTVDLPRRVTLPGFIADDEIGLGDVVKRVAATVGVRPCRGCQGRAAILNRWLVFSGRTK